MYAQSRRGDLRRVRVDTLDVRKLAGSPAAAPPVRQRAVAATARATAAPQIPLVACVCYIIMLVVLKSVMRDRDPIRCAAATCRRPSGFAAARRDRTGVRACVVCARVWRQRRRAALTRRSRGALHSQADAGGDHVELLPLRLLVHRDDLLRAAPAVGADGHPQPRRVLLGVPARRLVRPRARRVLRGALHLLEAGRAGRHLLPPHPQVARHPPALVPPRDGAAVLLARLLGAHRHGPLVRARHATTRLPSDQPHDCRTTAALAPTAARPPGSRR